MAHTPPGRTRERVLRWVSGRLLEGRPPTVREVQKAMGFRAVESARKHLEALVADGRLAKDASRARGYRLPGHRAGRSLAHVPLLGEVRAGAPALAIEEPEGWIPVAASRRDAQVREMFALRVRGDSMIDAGIFPGDIVIVRRQPRAESGDLVVALLEDEATVKTYRERRGRVELHPANPAYSVIYPEPSTLHILGIVFELRRSIP